MITSHCALGNGRRISVLAVCRLTTITITITTITITISGLPLEHHQRSAADHHHHQRYAD